MTNTTAELLTFAQAAQRLNVGVLTVRSWVRIDRCPVVRDDGRMRIPAVSVDTLIAKGWQA